MKCKFFQSLAVIITVFMCTGISAGAIDVEFTDSSMNLEYSAFVENDILMVPLREMLEKLDFLVTWNAQDGAVEMLRVNTTGKIRSNNETAFINGEPFVLPCRIRIINDRAYCPLVFIEKVSGLDYSWDFSEKKLILLAESKQFNAFSFVDDGNKKKIVIKNPLNPKKWVSLEAAYAMKAYPDKEAYVGDGSVVIEVVGGSAEGTWGYAKYDAKDLNALLKEKKPDRWTVSFFAKTTSQDAAVCSIHLKDGLGVDMGIDFDVDSTSWKEYSFTLDMNPKLNFDACYALLCVRRFTSGDKVYFNGFAINPAE